MRVLRWVWRAVADVLWGSKPAPQDGRTTVYEAHRAVTRITVNYWNSQ